MSKRARTAALIDELTFEDRINDEVRVILEAFQEDMRQDRRQLPRRCSKR